MTSERGYLKKKVRWRDIEDGLSRLEEAQTAVGRVMKVAHHIEDGVKTVGANVKEVGYKINWAIESTLNISATHELYHEPMYV